MNARTQHNFLLLSSCKGKEEKTCYYQPILINMPKKAYNRATAKSYTLVHISI
jgi:hypothetical protein